MMSQTPDLPSLTRPHCRTDDIKRNNSFKISNKTARMIRQPSSLKNLSSRQFLELKNVSDSESNDGDGQCIQQVENIEDVVQHQILQEESMKKLKVKIKNQLYNFKSSSKRSMKKVDINLQQIDELIVKILGFQENVYINLGYEVKYLKMKTQLQKLFM